MDLNNVHVTPCEKNKGRKKSRQHEQWKRVQQQTMRHKPKDLPVYPKCNHTKAIFSCKELTMKDIQQFHSMLYSTTNKVKQDIFILKFCEGIQPKRALKNSHRISIKYHAPTVNGDLKRICKEAFLSITHLSGDRVERIVAKFIHSGEIPRERRGGNKIMGKNDALKLSIKRFIESLPCSESHYCRGRTSRIFLSCDLNFVKLFKLYIHINPGTDVKLSYFRTYLNANYNLSFGTPLTDLCSLCLRTKELVKNAKSEEEKIKLMVEQRVHNLKAKAFYDLLNSESEHVDIFSFDCQKNLGLPKLPDQSAYFSQQINLYNFTVVSGSSKVQLSPETVTSYVWLESQYSKNSNAIASAVHNTLLSHTFSKNVEKIQLFADGCGGQNKNSTMMSMLLYYLGHEAPDHIKSLEFVFPIVGHSFLPPDRVFGLIERKVKKQTIIINRGQYENVIETYSSVRRLDEDWHIFDWKTAAGDVVKKPGQWHFKFNDCKRFIFTKGKTKNNVTVRGEIFYKSDLNVDKSIVKRSKSLSTLRPQRVTTGNCLRGDKSSIGTLLKNHYGSDWKDNPDLEFFKIIECVGQPMEEHNSSDREDFGEEQPETLRV